jgi:hypothetical protein
MFNQKDPVRITGSAWPDILHKWNDFISDENGHPNIRSIRAHADKICAHVRKYS